VKLGSNWGQKAPHITAGQIDAARVSPTRSKTRRGSPAGSRRFCPGWYFYIFQ